MSSRFQILGIILFFLLLTVVAYKMGQADQPPISYETAFEIVKDSEKINASKKMMEQSQEMFSYVPAYSHVYIAEGKPLALAITLSLRNVDSNNSVHIQKSSLLQH